MTARLIVVTLVPYLVAAAALVPRGHTMLALVVGLHLHAALSLATVCLVPRVPRVALRVTATVWLTVAGLTLLRPALLLPASLVVGELLPRATDDDVTVLGDDDALSDDEAQALAVFVPALRRALVPVLGAPGSCPVELVVTSGEGRAARAPFGGFVDPLLGPPAVLHVRGAGIGSVAHHLVYAWAGCQERRWPRFLVVGLAARVEKLVATRGEDGALAFDFAYRSDWRRYDAAPHAPAPDVPLVEALSRADDQDLLRAFTRFLDAKGFLVPLAAAVRAGRDVNEAMAAVTGLSPDALDAALRVWLTTESGRDPVLYASTAPGLESL